jgi:hypothetical protein
MSGARLIASKAVRLSIARFKALSALHRRRDSRIDEVDMELIEDSADTPEKVVLNLDLGAQLRICLAQLSRDHREILDLVYYQQKSIEETAEVIQMWRRGARSHCRPGLDRPVRSVPNVSSGFVRNLLETTEAFYRSVWRHALSAWGAGRHTIGIRGQGW